MTALTCCQSLAAAMASINCGDNCFFNDSPSNESPLKMTSEMVITSMAASNIMRQAVFQPPWPKPRVFS